METIKTVRTAPATRYQQCINNRLSRTDNTLATVGILEALARTINWHRKVKFQIDDNEDCVRKTNREGSE
ncbi:hypothetical protein J6590_010406 [Homalodisca vitripennis]|nr:hypothetical protein J6590_010406 [Homalodisca vitripennis]